MKYARSKLIGYGILILAGGVLLQLLATGLLGALIADSADPIGASIINFIVALLRFGAATLGAMMIALGIAIHLIEKGKEVETADSEERDNL